MAVIDCHEIRGQILTEAKKQIEALPTKPKLTIITIGHDDASEVYVRNKIKTATSLGIEVSHAKLEEDITQERAEKRIKLEMEYTDAIMLQLPIPKHLDEKALINLIPQEKDVDGLTDLNMGMLVNNHPHAIVPATAMGVYKVISHVLETSDLSGVNIAVVNRSKLIGKPLQALLTNHNATVTLCHSKTDSLNHYTWNSHVVVTGVGKPKFFENTDFNYYQLIVDCGINRDEDGKLCGDVDSESLSSFGEDGIGYTPVPGGVGILTTACLMLSVIQCYNLQH
jgi:methylenetetrahydrofolate dehydrogenase (NADP+)/methenyltetrahydrofolate cyclohydrolase